MIHLSLSKIRVCFSDAKWFDLYPLPNFQTNRIWGSWGGGGVSVPRGFKGNGKGGFGWWEGVYSEVNRGQAGLPSYRHWQAISLNAAGRSLPENAHLSRKTTYWWIRNGATALTTNAVLNFLSKNVCGPDISQIDWPPYSPNLNPFSGLFQWSAFVVRSHQP